MDAVTVHTFHLATTRVTTTVRSMVRPPMTVPGLRHAEYMTTMPLGGSLLSPARLRPRHFAMFAAWEDEAAVDAFLADTALGAELAFGWHVRLSFVRRWGRIAEFDGLPTSTGAESPESAAVVVTLARLKLTQVPRFAKWGKPVEQLVRDHPATSLALAATRPPRTAATFSVWRTEREMTDMVMGTPVMGTPVMGGADIDGAARHAAAMAARERKDFHHEFTTLRFRPISEHGTWEGRSRIIPTSRS